MYKRYFELCKMQKTKIFIGIVLLLISTVVTIRIPFVLDDTIEKMLGVIEGDYIAFLLSFLLYIFLFILQSILDYSTTVIFKKIGNKNATIYAERIAKKIINAKKTVPDQINSGKTMVVLTDDVFGLGESGILLGYRLIHLIINIGALLFYMIDTNILMTVLITFIFILSISFQNVCNKKVGDTVENGKKASGNYFYTTNVLVEHHDEHYRNGAREYIVKKFKNNVLDLLEQRLFLSRKISGMQMGSTIFLALNISTIFLLGTFLVKNGVITLSQLITFNMFSNSFGGYLGELPTILVEKKQFDIACIRTNEFMQLEEYEKRELDIEDIKNIELRNVAYKYDTDNEYAIFDINFELQKGRVYCVEGSNGSGKSTLLGIIDGDYEPSIGEVYLDGKNIDLHRNKEYMKRYISTFSANAILYNDTIIKNILLDRQIELKKVREICEILGINEWIETLPDKYNTVIDEVQGNLSDGQKQKIALARFFINMKQISIMDEVEKYLDSETKRNIAEFLNSCKEDKIIILSSHDEIIKQICDDKITLENKDKGRKNEGKISSIRECG